MGGKSFNPDKDIPNLSGKVIFITGGTAGLGKESLVALAKHNPEHIYFSGRDSKRAAAVISDCKDAVPNINLTFIECDLASLASVETAAKQFTSISQRIDILMCNAGVMALPPGLTEDGYEVQFGTNHMGHALLVKLLLPTLLRTAEMADSDVRIIFLTSTAFRTHPKGGVVFKDLRTTQDSGVVGQWYRYGQSKLANILYAAELARRYPNITTVSIHPGIIATGLVGNLSLLNKGVVYLANLGRVKSSVADGTWNQLWAATEEKSKIVNGAYYEPVAILGKLDKESKSEKLAEELWEWTEKELDAYQA
ncbi:uncharacterized protein V1513DRAFT_428251 [Lipomyces chichibuensis]|uniref:uncharacterized protein n=1 Tax=Lipomyces chichibuensis TaxID=1546026 RepID=UPI0033433741